MKGGDQEMSIKKREFITIEMDVKNGKFVLVQKKYMAVSPKEGEGLRGVKRKILS